MGRQVLFLAASGCVCLGASAGQSPVTCPHGSLKELLPLAGSCYFRERGEGKRRPNDTAVEDILVF